MFVRFAHKDVFKDSPSTVRIAGDGSKLSEIELRPCEGWVRAQCRFQKNVRELKLSLLKELTSLPIERKW